MESSLDGRTAIPEMIPVGNTVTPPNANQSLGMLSDLYGIKQQQLALQIGQANLAGVQAQSQQEQQKNQELQALARFSMNAVKDPNYLNEDGSLNVQKFQQGAMSVSPVYGAANIGQVTSNVKESVATRQAMQKLSEDQNSQISGMLKSLATNPGSTRSDLMDGVEQLRSNNKDPGFNRALDNMLFSFDLKDIPGSAAKTAAALGGLAMSEPGTQQLGGKIQPVAVMTMGPHLGRQTPVGDAVNTVTPAANTTNAAGQIVHIPTGGAGLPNTAGAAANPTNAAAASQVDDNARYKQISDAAQMSQSAQNLARNVGHLAQGVQTGKMSGEITDWLTTIRQDDPKLSDRQLLGKYAAQLQTLAMKASGGDTDLSRGVVLNGMPDPDHMGPKAIVDAARYIQGYFGMLGARGQVAGNYVRSNGGSPVGLRATIDDDFMRHANPDVFTYINMQPGQERQEWLKKHGYSDPQANSQLRRQLQVMSQYGVQ